jgi:hypothetical protein
MERWRSAIRISLLALLGFTILGAQAARQRDTITITGTLVRVAGVGGETTGWAIQLDSEIEVHGERLNSIEVSGSARQFAMLENKHVQAIGKIALHHGVTRGEWPVLEVSSIRESHGKRKDTINKEGSRGGRTYTLAVRYR